MCGRRRIEQEGATISTSLTPSPVSEQYPAGTFPGPGTYFCVECGSHLSLREDESLPNCPRCRASSFRRDSIFESMQEHGETTVEYPAPPETAQPSWLAQEQAKLSAGERRLAYRGENGAIRCFPVDHGWTRIGRSVSADVRLDHPSVSRRHALVVSEPGEPLRVLDDRSLNGVLVNGDMVEWSKLTDGDELKIGRYSLFVLEG